MKTFLLFLIGAFIMMCIVNYNAPQATHQAVKERCTRYCHDKVCTHFQDSFTTYQETFPFASYFRHLYRKNIQALKQNSLGFSYRQINLLIYVILFPLISLLLVWGAFRNRHTKTSHS